MPAATEDRPDIVEKAQKTRYKMNLTEGQYIIECGGRLPAGAVVLVDEETAIRWFELGIAEPADPDTPTFAEHVKNQKREAFLANARPVNGVYDQMVSRGQDRQNTDPYELAKPMPVPERRRGRQRPALDGAEVVSDPSGDDE